ncbi:MAG TPA: Stk1 family PASTA domain-containing Ser/Thr kinase [Oscillospiraceae bacterium]|nr:Stk1 family PASTA domain-containing Ser/Thr kinase [Oscillospiraceae bacterium]HPS74945.1 Stk1 family PASTA domain-containing Ser/Thr kinase [Oscillospiraceae bacterium]
MDNLPENDKYIGRILDGRYEILERIGSGGMSVVYKALCHRLNRYDAIKILRDDLSADGESRERFQAESQAIAMLSHPNIVSVYDVGHLDDMEYIVMELVDGITLKQYMQKKGALSWKETLHFSIQIAKALAHAHEKGIIHRDIKPQNIMLLKDGTIKVADFGIAELQSSLSGSSDQAVGSVHYMAPEQAKGAVADARSDIYSLGVVMYEMLTGALPYTGDTPEEIAIKHINGNPVSPHELAEDVPVKLEEITLRAMSSDLQSRYQSADEMLADLEEFRKDQAAAEARLTIAPDVAPIRERGGMPREQYKQRKKRSRKVTILSGVFGVLLLIIGLFAFLWSFWLKGLFTEGEQIKVPSFVGQNCEDVMNDQQYKGIYNFTVKIQIDQDHEQNTILGQSPEAGKEMSLVDEGINVELTISSGYTSVQIPDIPSGRYTEAEATAILEESGFKVAEEQIASDTIKEGYVVSTSPASGETLDVGSTVYLMVSSGPEVKKIAMPNLIGRTEADARAKLTLSNLHLGNVSYVEKDYDDDSMYGVVIWQSVDADIQVDEGTEIYIQISAKPAATPTSAG